MTITCTFLNDATEQPAVYIGHPELGTFTLRVTTDVDTPVDVPAVLIRFPAPVLGADQVRDVAVSGQEWRAAADGMFLTLTPSGPVPSLSRTQPLVIGLTGVRSTGTEASSGPLEVVAGGEAPTTTLFRMRYPSGAGDLTAVLRAEFLPDVVLRTPHGYSTPVRNTLTLRLVHLAEDVALVQKPWVDTPTVRLSFVYGDDIGSLTNARPPGGNPYSAFDIEVEASATYRDGTARYEWTSSPPEPGIDPDAGETPVWTLQPAPENQAVLGAGSGATAEFRISGLSTRAPAGNTLAYLQLVDFPGYDDAHLAVPLSKDTPHPGVVFLEGRPTYIAALGDPVTLEWETRLMARVELLRDGTPVPGPLEPASGSHVETIDRSTAYTLRAFQGAGDLVPARVAQWTARVPHARITAFTGPGTVVAGSAVTLTWATEFARAATITGGLLPYDVPADRLGGGSLTVYPDETTTYTLHVTGEGDPPDQRVGVSVVDGPGWSSWPVDVSFPPAYTPVLFGTDTGLTLVLDAPGNAVFRSPDGHRWEKVCADPFPPRTGGAGALLNGRMWIMGGVAASGPLNDVWYSDDEGRTWTQATPHAAWPARSGFACVAFGDRLWILGGTDTTTGMFGDVWSTPDGVTWTQADPAGVGWTPRFEPAVGVAHGQIWLFGGYTGQATNELWRTTDGTWWERYPPAGVPETPGWPTARTRASLAFDAVGDRLWLFGGVGDGGPPLDDLHVMDKVWQRVDGPPGWDVSGPACTAWRGAFWLAGGFSSDPIGPSTTVWSWLPESSPDG